jgi:diguanylate cyclase (GGDEF)-like protein/PAS domain S-box-containing protein
LRWLRRQPKSNRPSGAITVETVSQWIPMVAGVTGYGVTIVDAQRRLVWVNDSFTRMTGYAVTEAASQKTSDLLYFEGTDPETVHRVREAFAAARGVRFEVLVRSKDGREWWLDTDARPLFDDHGTLQGWVCIQADVTAEVQKREASRRNESRVLTMIQGGNIGTWEWDATTNLVETNAVFLSMLGFPASERSHSLEWLRGLYHEDDRPGSDRGIQEVVDGRTDLYRGQHRLRARDGSWRWVLGAVGVVERAPDGKPLRMFGVQLDITEHKLAEVQRGLAAERLALIADNVPGMIFQWRMDRNGRGDFLYASPGSRLTCGLSPEELKSNGAAFLKIIHPEDQERVVASMRRARETLGRLHFEHRVVRPDGVLGWVEGDAVARQGEDGSTVWNGYVGDVTLSKRALEELRLSEANLRNLYDLSPLGIALNDMEGRFLQTNRSVEIITGYSQEEILQSNWSVFSIRQGNSEELPRLESLVKDGRFGPVEMSLRRKDGSRVPVQIMGIIVQAHDGTRRIWSMLEDISVRKRSEQHISFLAYHDPLTSLENRLGLRSKLEELLRASIRADIFTAVVLIDLDRFKYVNDTLGHDVGDELLVEVARRLTLTVRDADVVARLGGDEFVLVLGGLPDESHVDVIMQKIFGELRGNIQLSGRTVYSTCSIGISIAPRHGTDSSTLLKHADLAMYAAKAQGGDSYRLFDDWMRPGTDRLSLEVELRDALERDELEVYYQLRVDTLTGRPTALEALLRWHHPTRGLVLPGVFIPIAEETGLIDSMGQWVLERACQDARAWIVSGGGPLQVSVNLSPVQFARDDLSERVAAALAAAHLAPQLLELEITETLAMRSPELAARHLARLRILGVSLAIDDFGTGHSSLSRLKLLNVNCVKIDQSLIKDCTANAHDGALCRAAIALGLALGLEVVAEGVETEAQRQFLAQEHCSTIQGYLIARPMPAADAFALAGSLLKVPRIHGAVGK